MDKFRLAIWPLKFKFVRLLEHFPVVYMSLSRVLEKYFKRRTGTLFVDSDIVIEGFPRSSNSFAVRAFEFSQSKKLKIATHYHSHVPILEAIRIGVPVLVLIRHPMEAVISLKAMDVQLNKYKSKVLKIKKLRYYLRWYINFYKALAPVKNKVVWATFEEVTSDFGLIVERLNDFYDCSFEIFEHNPKNVDQIFARSGQHLSPSKERNALKEILLEEYNNEKKLAVIAEAEFKKITEWLKQEV